jgi:hypothetical protein
MLLYLAQNFMIKREGGDAKEVVEGERLIFI